jgi:hypothetical protein
METVDGELVVIGVAAVGNWYYPLSTRRLGCASLK